MKEHYFAEHFLRKQPSPRSRRCDAVIRRCRRCCWCCAGQLCVGRRYGRCGRCVRCWERRLFGRRRCCILTVKQWYMQKAFEAYRLSKQVRHRVPRDMQRRHRAGYHARSRQGPHWALIPSARRAAAAESRVPRCFGEADVSEAAPALPQPLASTPQQSCS